MTLVYVCVYVCFLYYFYNIYIYIFIYIYIYIYIYCYPQTDCFVASQLFNVARHERCFKIGTETQLTLYQSDICVNEGIFLVYIHSFSIGYGRKALHLCLSGSLQFLTQVLYICVYVLKNFHNITIYIYIYTCVSMCVSVCVSVS